MGSRRQPIYGPEPWAEHAGRVWSHWDLWFCLVCLTDADGDWDALTEAIIERHRRRSVTSRDWEAKLSHLDDLRARFGAAELGAIDLAGEAVGDKQLLAKARRKVLEQALAGRDLTRRCGTRPGSGCSSGPTGPTGASSQSHPPTRVGCSPP